jgi:hypothetical protein
MTAAPTRTPAAAPHRAPTAGPGGGALVAANRWFTWVFAAWSLLAVLVRPTRVALAGVDVAALVVGCVLYLVAYATAVARSRTDAIGLGALFFLTDGAAPAAVRRSFWLWTSVQVVVGLAAAAARPFTPVAFGVLAPIVGLGLMGLWGARHGVFPERFGAAPGAAEPTPAAPLTHGGAQMEQNDDHG